MSELDLAPVETLAQALRTEINKAIIGQQDTIELMLVALLSGGHILLEGVPGTAKTFLAQAFSYALKLDFGRIQFTPDLLPGDLLGTNLFNFQTSKFSLIKGPIFCDLLLADEINRTPPKTQAALLEAMQERQVTIDGKAYPLAKTFMVIATQNPIEQQGTYPLPEAQLDRFLFKHVLDYPSRDEELEIIARHGTSSGSADLKTLGLKPIATPAKIKAALDVIPNVRLTDDVTHYIVDLVRGTRNDPLFETGASPRAAAMIAIASRAKAALAGRDYVIPDDVKAIALPALRHRAILSPTAEIEGRNADSVISAVIEQTNAPR
ncbi:MoxR-like ATPase [Litorimonas taeanensis]|uniref:MoxR-like ATPase n=1 Tax=Litorimonas taeanensis TaxID=568099 RepID=A0A420WMI8_9PROT|nr:MoxR family ATPase [Litorimonas taeanensis]RKQ72105.1 MoxR-like ATPase [Litorimonas taeanensis]